LTPQQRQVLTQTARDCFDPAVQVRLFGSRADDARKGGDIDLLIETQLQDPAQIARAHTQFLARVYMALGEQKIDVLIDYPSCQSQAPIYQLARQGCCCERSSCLKPAYLNDAIDAVAVLGALLDRVAKDVP
jgi:hypothetical protein